MKWTAFALLLLLVAAPGLAQEAAPPLPGERQSMEDAWWTGPMLAPNASTLPRGHFLIEPYIFDVISRSRYDSRGTKHAVPHSHFFGNLTYLNYGLTNRVTVGMIPTEGYSMVSSGRSSARVGFGDVSALVQVRLTQFREGHRTPTMSLALQEKFPTGKYDRLGDRPSAGIGGGAHTTSLSFYSQDFFWLPNGRILRMRFNATQSFSDTARVRDVSVYGTADGFRGHAKPGPSILIDNSWEYSWKRGFVLATDLTYEHDANTRIWGTQPDAGGTLVPLQMNSGASDAFAVAPAIEYSWRPNLGVLLGVRLFPAGRNTSASVTPVIAINFFK